jgi:hypothetical protein
VSLERLPLARHQTRSRGARWHVSEEGTLDHLVAALLVQAECSRAVIEAHDLAEKGQPGPRWCRSPSLQLPQPYIGRVRVPLVDRLAFQVEVGPPLAEPRFDDGAAGATM